MSNATNNSTAAEPLPPVGPVLNFNLGVLGHVDSGKTSLVKVLSTVSSTACFDKNPQSQERGITLDLGFSSFQVDMPEHMKTNQGEEKLQYTLVDCPGHASLIRTIIGGAQIIDLMLLVVDVTKGIQTQTAECLVIGEITCDKMIVVLNKIDLIEESKRSATIERMTKKLQKTLEATKFSGCRIIPVAARPGGPESSGEGSQGLNELIEVLRSSTYLPLRDSSGSLVFSVDHCFSIRGQGTVMTGTIISGAVNINDNVEIPSLKITKKVKSMQMFKKPCQSARQGDRVGICVTQFDPKQLERGLVCTPGSLSLVSAAIARISKISYFKGSVSTKAKFHITIGHETVMSRGTFFSRPIKDGGVKNGVVKDGGVKNAGADFDYETEYRYEDELVSSSLPAAEATTSEKSEEPREYFVLLEFETAIVCSRNFLVIGSKLDTDIHVNTCRIAFHGRVVEPLVDKNYAETLLPRVRVYKNKQREGAVERKVDEYTLVCKGLFKKESDLKAFLNLKVKLSTGEEGVIEGGFGQSGKFKVRIPNGLGAEAGALLAGRGGGKKGKGGKQEAAGAAAAAAASGGDGAAGGEPDSGTTSTQIRVLLHFKRYIYDISKKMIQT